MVQIVFCDNLKLLLKSVILDKTLLDFILSKNLCYLETTSTLFSLNDARTCFTAFLDTEEFNFHEFFNNCIEIKKHLEND